MAQSDVDSLQKAAMLWQALGEQGVKEKQQAALLQQEQAKQAQLQEQHAAERGLKEKQLAEEIRHNKSNEALMGLLRKQQASQQQLGRPMSVEQERSENLAKESIEAGSRLSKNIEKSPNLARFVAATENIPVIGGLAQGAASLIWPETKDIAADRVRLTQNMGFAKSGANVPKDEKAGIATTLPGVSGDVAKQQSQLDTFLNPFRSTQAMHASKTQGLPPAAAVAAPQAAARTVVKTLVSPSTGKRKIIYSDGTSEIQ